jgi:hypothetical protein
LASYHVLVETQDNFDMTAGTATYIGTYKEFYLQNNLAWDAAGGYVVMKASGYSGFLYAKAGIAYKYKDIVYSFNSCFNSGSSQFSGRADLAFWLGVRALF